jgi:hypothetical protein
MSLLSVSAASTDFVEVEVSASESPVGYPVSFAFPTSHALSDDPATTWVGGSWRTDANGAYWAQCLVGPEGVVDLDRGLYLMYVKWELGGQKPAACAGTLEVY